MEKFLLEQLRDRSLDSIFEQTSKVYKKKLDAVTIKDERHIMNLLELTEELHSFQIPNHPDSRLNFYRLNLITFYSIH